MFIIRFGINLYSLSTLLCQFISVFFFESVNLNQRTRALVIVSKNNICLGRKLKQQALGKNWLRDKNWTITRKKNRFRIQECHWLRLWTISSVIFNHLVNPYLVVQLHLDEAIHWLMFSYTLSISSTGHLVQFSNIFLPRQQRTYYETNVLCARTKHAPTQVNLFWFSAYSKDSTLRPSTFRLTCDLLRRTKIIPPCPINTMRTTAFKHQTFSSIVWSLGPCSWTA